MLQFAQQQCAAGVKKRYIRIDIYIYIVFVVHDDFSIKLKSNNPPPSQSKDSAYALSKLTEDKFSSLEASIVSVEEQRNKYHEQFIDMIKHIQQKANLALSLATSNSKLIAENTERMSAQQFDYQSLVERIETLETKYKELTYELEESKNRSMCKTLFF